MTTYKATTDQWAYQEHWSKEDGDAACLLELRSRVEALEANTKQWRTDHLRLANTCASLAPDRLKFFNALLPDAEDSQPTPNPIQIRSWLVDRVARAIGRDDEPINWEPEARAAIHEVAAWMTSNPDVYFPPALVFALEQEVER
jgi:hypothetical protein